MLAEPSEAMSQSSGQSRAVSCGIVQDQVKSPTLILSVKLNFSFSLREIEDLVLVACVHRQKDGRAPTKAADSINQSASRGSTRNHGVWLQRLNLSSAYSGLEV